MNVSMFHKKTIVSCNKLQTIPDAGNFVSSNMCLGVTDRYLHYLSGEEDN